MENLQSKLAFIRKDAQGTLDGQFADEQLRNNAERHASQVVWLTECASNINWVLERLNFLLSPPPPEPKRIFLVKGNTDEPIRKMVE